MNTFHRSFTAIKAFWSLKFLENVKAYRTKLNVRIFKQRLQPFDGDEFGRYAGFSARHKLRIKCISNRVTILQRPITIGNNKAKCSRPINWKTVGKGLRVRGRAFWLPPTHYFANFPRFSLFTRKYSLCESNVLFFIFHRRLWTISIGSEDEK